MRQVVQGRDDIPAVHLALVDLLGAVIEPRGIAEADRIGGREQPEIRVRADHLVLVEQRQLAFDFQHALDHEHDVRAAGVVLVENDGRRVLQRPGQDALAEFGHLHAVLQHDGVLADQVDTRDVAVQVDADARPVEARGDLFDVGRLTCTMVALHHDAAVVGETSENGQRRIRIEPVGVVHVRHMIVHFAERRHFHVRFDTEDLAYRNGDVRFLLSHGFRGVDGRTHLLNSCIAGCRNRAFPPNGATAREANPRDLGASTRQVKAAECVFQCQKWCQGAKKSRIIW